MKQLAAAIFCLTAAILMAVGGIPSLPLGENTVVPARLDAQEDSLLRLVGNGKNVNVFDYRVDDGMRSLSVWIESYRKGEGSGKGNLARFPLQGKQGRLAVTMEEGADCRWTVTLQDDGGISSSSFETEPGEGENIGAAAGFVTLSEETAIESEGEIVLLLCYWENGRQPVFRAAAGSVGAAEAPGQYDCAYLLKCSFSRRTTAEAEMA